MRDSSPKKLLVDPVVRGVFVRRFLLCWACCTILAAILLTAVRTFAEPDQTVLAHFGTVIATHWPILGMSVAMLPIIVWDAVRFSRRIAGPICGVRRSLSRHADGEKIRPLQFRGNDLWKDLGDQINVLLNRLQEVEAKADAAERSSRRGERVVVHDQQKRDERKPYGTRSRRKTVSRGLFRVLTPPAGAASSERSCS
ncbi:MAG: hypothetical protein ISR77_21165 [Pirellulaceae bacterium]|nr:hypothetical protein [Pirellulaceae bacterium]